MDYHVLIVLENHPSLVWEGMLVEGVGDRLFYGEIHPVAVVDDMEDFDREDDEEVNRLLLTAYNAGEEICLVEGSRHVDVNRLAETDYDVVVVSLLGSYREPVWEVIQMSTSFSLGIHLLHFHLFLLVARHSFYLLAAMLSIPSSSSVETRPYLLLAVTPSFVAQDCGLQRNTVSFLVISIFLSPNRNPNNSHSPTQNHYNFPNNFYFDWNNYSLNFH